MIFRTSFLLLALLLTACGNSADKKSEDSLPASQANLSPELKESISRGAGIYNSFCASCHLSGGEGIEGTFPPLKDSDWLREKRAETIHAIKYGLSGEIEVNGQTYNNFMPDLGLSDQETADVLNYIFNSWGNNVQPPVTKEEVAAIEK